MSKNTPKDIQNFFSEGTTKVTVKEFGEFWKSLSEDDKNYYRNVDLTQ